MPEYRHQHIASAAPSISTSPVQPPASSSAPSMSNSHRTSSQESIMDGVRKRVCKACDRCRLKKSKCDGASPCYRCRQDNTVCVFGERKKSHDKVYPKGYVEMLEQQQTKLVEALQEMYHRAKKRSAWNGPDLDETSGRPLTHDILVALNLLTNRTGSPHEQKFEEDTEKIQADLFAQGAGIARRRRSVSSESESSNIGHGRVPSVQHTPAQPRPSIIKQEPNLASSTSSPAVQSPVQTFSQPQERPVAAQSNAYQGGEASMFTNPTPFGATYMNDHTAFDNQMFASDPSMHDVSMASFSDNDAGFLAQYTWTPQQSWQDYAPPTNFDDGMTFNHQQWPNNGQGFASPAELTNNYHPQS